MKTVTLLSPTAAALSLSALPLRERLPQLRAWDAQTPCGSLLVLEVIELDRPTAGLHSLTPEEVTAYFASGYELLPLSQTLCNEGTVHRFLLKKHNDLDPTLIAQALLRLPKH